MRRLIPLLVVVALAAGACGGGGDDDAGSGDNGDDAKGLQVSGDEYSFEPATLTAEAGTVTITLKNTGTLEHDFTIDQPKLQVAVLAGMAKTGSVEMDPGTYKFYCSVPGHEAVGMKGEMTVS
ncbi:MAG TPA: cupredoxin domain-containing protein [Acidimicrobiia bacterium]|nr:cupredoxin domain-containing protein [Acidimicrobiia bacterium]